MCMGMYGNGYRIHGMILITALRLMAVLGEMELAITGCFMVAVGPTVPVAAGQPAATVAKATAPTTWAFAFFWKCNPFLLYPFTTYNSLQS